MRGVEEGLEEGGVAPPHRQVEEGQPLGGAGVGGGALGQDPRHRGGVARPARRDHRRLHPPHRQPTGYFQSESQLKAKTNCRKQRTLQYGD